MSSPLRIPRVWVIAPFGIAVVTCAIAAIAVWTAPTRDAVQVYLALIAAANRQDVSAAQSLCSTRYRNTHSLLPAKNGGLIGLPRNIHKNFQTWREGPNVWLCPTNRVGPVYQFVFESGRWRFDGPIGVLRPGGRVVRFSEGAPEIIEEEVEP
jgi:hypothetical protein